MHCKNCNTNLNENQNYCFECGAKIIKQRLTLKHISEDVIEQFFNIDNKLLQTFIQLFTKPEAVINSFIEGTRKKHINVIQYFALSLTLVGIQIFLMNTFFKDAISEGFPFLENLDSISNSEKNPFEEYEKSVEIINNYQSLVYILSVPISAIASWLSYSIFLNDKRYNFTEHIVINLFYSSQTIIVTAALNILFLCFGLNYFTIASFISILSFIYYFYVLKRVFNTNFIDTIARYLIIFLVYSIMILILLIITVIIGLIIVSLKN